jgi:signal transduction histidine kinase
MKDAVEFLLNVFEFYHIQIYLVDPANSDLVARHGAGAAGDRLAEQGYVLPAGSGIPGHVAETGEPFFTNKVDQVVFYEFNPLLPETRSELVLPIKTEAGMLGVLDIHQTASHPINSRQMKLMSAVAQQMAIALQRADLYMELQNSLNTEKLMRTKLIQSERLALAGQLLASVSHELNNPLQAIQNALFLLKEEKRLSEQGSQDLEIVLSETERMASILNRLRSTYRPIQSEELEEAQINDLIENTYALTATLFRHKEIAFEFSPDPELPAVACMPDQIKQVMLNLIMNSVEAMPNGGKLRVQTRNLPEQDQVLIAVTDNGVGIEPDSLEQIFEPFFTNKSTGTGIGLTITRDIINQHSGEILAENNAQGGATFKVWLPVTRKE